MFLDLDGFKAVNDTHGHDTGDDVLRLVASRLSRVGDGGRAFRYGGEEFMLLLPGLSVEGATERAEEIRTRVAALALGSEAGNMGPVTVSIGVAITPLHCPPDRLVRTADSALLRAKATPQEVAEVGADGGDDPMAALQRLLGDPAVLLGAVQSPEQAELAPRLDAAVAAVVGYIDYTVDSVAVRVVGGDALRIAEAVRRRRVETGPDDLFVERLLGMRLDLAQVQRGKEFVGGVVDRVGEARLTSLFDADDPLPTPAELDAPGLWVARLEL